MYQSNLGSDQKTCDNHNNKWLILPEHLLGEWVLKNDLIMF